MATIGKSTWQQRATIGGLLAILMVVTRYHHFGSALLLPDASWAIFITAGFYLSRSLWFVVFLALAAGIDYYAFSQDSSIADCFSVAYPFLAPAYASLWWGGHWFSRHQNGSAADVVQLTAMTMVATTNCFIISNGAFYWFAIRAEHSGIADFQQQFFEYYPPFLKTTLIYIAVFAAIHVIVMVLRDIYSDGLKRGLR